MARSQSRAAMAAVTAWVFSTHFISGTRTATLPTSVTTQGSVSGAASTSAITASAPMRQPRIRSKAEGAPPRWTWPSTVTRVSISSRSTITLLTVSAAMGWPCLYSTVQYSTVQYSTVQYS